MNKEEILEKIKKIEIASSLLANEIFSGNYRSYFKGNGMEFSDIRRYAPGDKEISPYLSDNSDTILYKEKFPYTFIVGIILGVVSLLYLVKGVKFKKKEKYISPEEKFEKRVASINNETWDFDLSMAIREYIDSRYQTHFINGNYEVVGMIDSEDIKFINNLDRYKFSKDSRDLKEETLKRVREIFEKVRGDKNV